MSELSSSPKIVVHWLNNSRSQRIIWVLEELSLPYTIVRYQRSPQTNLAPRELLAIHPLGKSPIITIEEPDEEKIVLAESGAVVEFILEKYGEGGSLVVERKAGIAQRANYLFWLHWAEGTVMGPLIMWIVFKKMSLASPFYIRPLVGLIASQALSLFVLPRLKSQFKFVNDHLEKNQYFVGDTLTGADIMMIFPVEMLVPSLGLEDYPHIEAWFKRVSERPNYKIAEEKGGVNNVASFMN